jgi:hypothetical protein
MRYFTAISKSYYKEAEQLVVSGMKHGYNIEVLEVPDAKSREHFINQKPTFIKKMMSSGGVCWLDSDTRICDRLPIIDNFVNDGFSFGVLCFARVRTPKGLGIINRRLPEMIDLPMLCSGGVYVISPNMGWLLDKWEENCMAKIEKEIGDDIRFDQTYNSLTQSEKLSISLLPLPAEYNRMISHFSNLKPIIDHLVVGSGSKLL